MTVNFGGIKNISGLITKSIPGDDGINWDMAAISMHLDKEDFLKAKKIVPDLKETDTFSIQAMRGSDDPIANSTIIVNDFAFVNGLVNLKYFKFIADLLNKVIKSDDEALKMEKSFIDEGHLKKDLFGSFQDPSNRSNAELVETYSAPKVVKSVAKEIIEEMRVNAAVNLADIRKFERDHDLVGNYRPKKDLLN